MRRYTCPYCHSEAELVGGSAVYPHRKDLASKCFWMCKPCDAYVGCHPGTDKPLGRLANSELRRWKMLAHSKFDPLWRSGSMSRSEAYSQLSKALGIPRSAAHIGMCDVEQWTGVVDVMRVEQEGVR